MKAFKPSFANVFFVLAISTILILLSFPAWAEDVQGSEAVGVTAEQIAGAISDQAAGEAAIDPSAEIPDESAQDTAPETNEKAGEEAQSSDSSTVDASTMSTMADGGVTGTDAKTISAVSIPTSDNFTGAASSQIPISVPAGRGGLTPNLSLTYSSGAKNGPAGIGWNIEVGHIQRAVKYGINWNADDYVAVSPGMSIELVSRQPDWGENFYGAKIEGAFTKYEKLPTGWEVTTKDGTKYLYGTRSDSILADPSDATNIFKWCLDTVRDTNGNEIQYFYEAQGESVFLKRVEYGASTRIDLYYDEDRVDPIRTSSATWLEDISYRFKSITITLNDYLMAGYKLEYSQSESGQSRLHNVFQYGSDLSVDLEGNITDGTFIKIAQMDYNGDEFSFQSGSTGPLYFIYNSQEGAAVDISRLRLGDFNGDAITDIAIIQGYGSSAPIQIYLADGDGTFTGPINGPMLYVTGSHEKALSDLNRIKLGDFNGDGKTDIAKVYGSRLLGSNERIRIYLSQYSNGVLSFSNEILGPSVWVSWFNLKIDVARINIADFNGDGLSDICRLNGNATSTPMSIYLANYNNETLTFSNGISGPNFWVDDCSRFRSGDFNGDGKADVAVIDGWGVPTPIRIHLSSYTNQVLTFSGPINGPVVYLNPDSETLQGDLFRTRLGDFNGDGKTDIAVIEGYGTLTPMSIYLAKGDGAFSEAFQGPPVFVNNSHEALYVDIPRVKLDDFNGDGKTDIGYVSGWGTTEPMSIYMSQGDGTFSDAVEGPSCFVYGSYGAGAIDVARVHSGDFNGDGKSDIIQLDGYGTAVPIIVNLWEDDPPNLLVTVRNAMGGSSQLSYCPSSKYENKKLPFVLHTIQSISINDGFNTLPPTTYTYCGGSFVSLDREFRGFEWVKKINPDGTTEKTGFLQGDFNKGRPFTTELRECDDDLETSLLNRTEYIWSEQNIGDEARFVYLEQKRNQLWEGGAHTVETIEEYTYSDYVTDHENAHGGIKTLITSVVPGELGETAITTKDYSNFGESGGWVWRMTMETLEGTVSGPNVRTTEYEYELNTGNLLKKRFFLNGINDPEFEYAYDDYGNLIRQWDPGNNLTETFYDPTTQTYPVEIRYPQTGEDPNLIDHIVYKQYDYKFGTIDIGTDENGNQTDYNYDEFGRLSSVSTYTPQPEHQLAAQTTYAYSFYVDAVHPNYTSTSVKETDTTTIDNYEYFDGLGRSLSSVSLGASGQTTRTLNTYDEMGRIWKVTGPFFNPGTGTDYVSAPPAGHYPITKTIYDKRGRTIEISSNDTVWGWNLTSFDYVGLSTTITDPDGKQKTERKDYLGRLIQVVEYNNAEQYTTTYAYNVAGDLLSVTDHLDTPTTMTYDNLGRKSTMTDPDMGYWTYIYDVNGNLVSQTDAKGQTIAFNYDDLNRVLAKTYDTGDPAVTYDYDNLLIPNGKGKLASVTNTNVTTVYNEYDAMGRARLITKTISGDSARATRYDYDYSGKLTHIGYPGTTGQPDGFQVYYAYYPGSGLLHTVTGSDMVEYANFSDYEPTGKIGAMDYGNGTSTSYAYDPKSTRLTGITTHDPSGLPENDIQRRTYNYSPAGDITGITDNLENIAYTYDYDGLHRLSWEKTNGAFTATYNYNAIGNITSKTMGTDTFTYAYHATKIHAVSQVTKNNGTPNGFSYDFNGNMTDGWDLSGTPVARTIAYNADNMPLAITKSGTTTSFAYDGQGSRVTKTVPGSGTTYYIGEHFEKINGDETIYIFAGDIRIARKQGTTTNYFHKDHLGSSTAMTDVSGIKVETSVYWPYGYMKSHWGSDVTGYKFTDQELDSSTGLYDYGARMYDPVIGRFITADTIVQSPGDPQTLNRYSYCRNNPLVYVDPSGQLFLVDDILIGAAIGALIGGATSAITGGDVGMGMLTGAIGGAFFGAAGGIIENSITQAAASAGMSFEAAAAAGMGMSSYAQVGLHFAAGAMSGGVNAGLTGSNVGLGMLTGGISGGMGKYFGGFLPDNYGAQLLGRSFIGGVTGGITAEMYGGTFYDGFINGAETGAIGFMCNDFAHFMIRAAQNRQMTGKFFDSLPGKGAKFLLGPITKLITGTTIPAEVAREAGTVPLGQGLRSLMSRDMAGLRGVANLGVGGTVVSMGMNMAVASVAGYVSFNAGLYVGSYVEAIPELFR